MSKRTKRLQDLRKKTIAQLQTILKEQRERLRQLRFDLAGGKLNKPHEIQKVKKDIARILTIINEKRSQ